MRVNYLTSIFLVLGISVLSLACSQKESVEIVDGEKTKLLVFSKTNAYRHDCIEVGVEAMKAYFGKRDILMVHSEDSSDFSKAGLADYDVIMFFNTSGNVLDSIQQEAFTKYIRDGNGFVGVHAAADTEYDWTWYLDLVGAQYASHGDIQPGVVMKLDTQHLSCKQLPDRWVRMDEWYNFKQIPTEVNVLLAADETTFSGGAHDSLHPMSWYHNYDGGRSFYTAMGHVVESYQDTLFLEHILQGVIWAAKKD